MGEAITIAVVAGAAGTFILWSTFGQFTAVLSLLTLFIYVALYTPLKRLSPWATFVGAIPGAFPPLLGYVAATGTFGTMLVPQGGSASAAGATPVGMGASIGGAVGGATAGIGGTVQNAMSGLMGAINTVTGGGGGP